MKKCVSMAVVVLGASVAAAADLLSVPEGFKPVEVTKWGTSAKSNGVWRVQYPWNPRLTASWSAPEALSNLVGRTVLMTCCARGIGKIESEFSMDGARWFHSTPLAGNRLLDRWMTYRFVYKPLKTDRPVKGINFGITYHGELKDVQLYVGDALPKPPPTNAHVKDGGKLPEGYLEGKDTPVPEGCVDLTPLVTEVPLAGCRTRPGDLTDGSFGTVTDVPTELRFPRPVTISEFRVTLPGSYTRLYADVTGSGRFEKVLDESCGLIPLSTWGNLRDWVWRRIVLEKPLTVRALLYVGRGHEVRVYGPAAANPGAASARAALPPAPAFAQTGAASTNWTEVAPADRLYYGFSLEPWMFGTEGHFSRFHKKNTPVPPLAEWREWRSLMDDFGTLYANFVLLFPPKTFVGLPGVKGRGTYPTPLLWPSDVWYCSQPVDLLSQINADLKRRGILDFVIPREWTFKTNGVSKTPQVEFAAEIAARGSDGVPACVDEQYWFAPAPGRVGKAPERKDTPEYRDWYVRKMKATAEWMAEIKARQERLNPDAVTFGGYGGCDYWQDRFQNVSGCDWWGFEGKVDVIGGDGTYFGVADDKLCGTGTYIPYVETAVQVACSAKRLSMATVNFNWGMQWDEKAKTMKNPVVYHDFPNTAHTAGALATYFAKGKYLDYWRHNFMDMKGPKTREAVRKGGFMVKKLAEWGGWKAQVPKDVLVLRSRTSEDWWRLSFAGWANTKKFPGTGVPSLGFSYFYFVVNNLCADAVPFEIYCLHRPETWKDRVKDYKAVVLPFAYAVSDEAVAALAEAAKAGVRILAPGAYPLGAVDDTGAKHPSGAFEGLPVERLDFNLATGDSEPETYAKFRGQVRTALAAKGGATLTLARDPHYDVQAYALEVSPKEKLVMVANWSERPTEVNLGVRLPDGSYRMDVCDGCGVRAGTIGGEGKFDAEDAANFRVSLKPEETLLFRFQKKGWFGW